MWEELVQNEIWLSKSFMQESLLEEMKSQIASADRQRLSPGDSIRELFDSIDVNPTLYDYTVHHAGIRDSEEIVEYYKSQFNILFEKLGSERFSETNLSPLQLFAKSFSPQSFYEIHAEPIIKYGSMAFVHFLEDCDGGELVFPDKKMSNNFIQKSDTQAKALESTEAVFNRLGEKMRWVGPLFRCSEKKSLRRFSSRVCSLG